jgi:hypothetical protein
MPDSMNAFAMPFCLESYVADLKEIGFTLDAFVKPIYVGEAVGEERAAIFKRCNLGLDRVYAKYAITTECQRSEANGKAYAYCRKQEELKHGTAFMPQTGQSSDPLLAAVDVANCISKNYPIDESLEDVWGDSTLQADKVILASQPNSMAGAIAGLEWLQKEIEQDMLTENHALLVANCVSFLKANHHGL